MQLNKKEAKRLYDIKYRRLNRDKLNKQKIELYNKIKDTDKYQDYVKKYRVDNRKQHTAYCAKPDQKLKTKKRDEIRTHGEYRECFELIEEILNFVRNHYNGSKYERLKARGYFLKYLKN